MYIINSNHSISALKNVMFRCFEHRNLNFIHLHCINVKAAISKLDLKKGQMKLKLSTG